MQPSFPCQSLETFGPAGKQLKWGPIESAAVHEQRLQSYCRNWPRRDTAAIEGRLLEGRVLSFCVYHRAPQGGALMLLSPSTSAALNPIERKAVRTSRRYR